MQHAIFRCRSFKRLIFRMCRRKPKLTFAKLVLQLPCFGHRYTARPVQVNLFFYTQPQWATRTTTEWVKTRDRHCGTASSALWSNKTLTKEKGPQQPPQSYQQGPPQHGGGYPQQQQQPYYVQQGPQQGGGGGACAGCPSAGGFFGNWWVIQRWRCHNWNGRSCQEVSGTRGVKRRDMTGAQNEGVCGRRRYLVWPAYSTPAFLFVSLFSRLVIVDFYTNPSLSMVCAMVCANEIMGAIGQC